MREYKDNIQSRERFTMPILSFSLRAGCSVSSYPIWAQISFVSTIYGNGEQRGHLDRLVISRASLRLPLLLY